ncbi:MAG: DUF2726 domain-containing protein [Pseudomonadota bacterium]
MPSFADLSPTRPSPFSRVLDTAGPLRALFRRSPSDRAVSRISSAEIIDTAAVAVAPLMDAARHDRFQQLCAIAHERGLHVAPEVSLGALFTLASPNGQPGLEEAAKALRGKRVDFVLIDGSANAVLAIDHRGDGRWRGRALRRDLLKRRAFERADIPLVEIGGPEDWAEDRGRILRLLGEVPPPTVDARTQRPAA